MGKEIELKKIKGITLISLVITIIILIILSSIAIYLSLGNNGIFNKAKEAKELTNKQEATERINLKITTAQMNKYAEKQEMPTLQELADTLYEDNEIQYVALETQVGSKEKITVGEKTSIFTKLKQYPYEFEINSSLQLASINGIKIANSNGKFVRKVIDKICYDSSGLHIDTIQNDGGITKSGTLTYDISKILPKYYKELTRDNFSLDFYRVMSFGADQGNLTTTSDWTLAGISSYENGILTINLPKHVRGGHGLAIGFDIIASYIE